MEREGERKRKYPSGVIFEVTFSLFKGNPSAHAI
jgi:hypothetical protein